MGLKHWIMPKDHFKTHLFFSIFFAQFFENENIWATPLGKGSKKRKKN